MAALGFRLSAVVKVIGGTDRRWACASIQRSKSDAFEEDDNLSLGKNAGAQRFFRRTRLACLYCSSGSGKGKGTLSAYFVRDSILGISDPEVDQENQAQRHLALAGKKNLAGFHSCQTECCPVKALTGAQLNQKKFGAITNVIPQEKAFRMMDEYRLKFAAIPMYLKLRKNRVPIIFQVTKV